MRDDLNLKERLREQAWTITHMEAADRIEALEGENERLREALGLIIENESADTGYGNSSAKIARAALKGSQQ